VRRASQGLQVEVFVVDNLSTDGSIAYLRDRFPEVTFIENKENVGFAKANNQAMRIAKGEYILLLNPDTVVEEDTFEKCIAFMDSHSDCGGLGIKMIDGQGNILKESKRGFPSPWASFCKMSGLTSLFPTSKKYAQYYMGHLSYEETNQVDILAGAYMMMRKECLDKVGLLDEDYFMYGEDIDLSYRITLGGYKNYYFPEATIIHYKGESTKKSSLNYVYTFYNAMAIFAKKHLDAKQNKLYSFIIKLAIWIKAFFGFFSRIFKNFALPFFDFALIYVAFYFLEKAWAIYYWGWADYYPPHYMLIAVPCYILILLTSVYVAGGYSKKVRIPKIISGIFSGMLVLLVFYSLLPSELRYSRALVVLGSVMSLGILLVVRFAIKFLRFGKFSLKNEDFLRCAIIADEQEAERVANLIHTTSLQPEFIALVSVGEKPNKESFVGTISQIDDIIRIYSINEVIFCAKSLSQSNINNLMNRLAKTNVKFTIVPPTADFIIGSNTINSPTDLYVVSLNSITNEDNKRKKRIFDFVTSLVLLIFSLLLMWFVKKPFGFVKNCVLVLLNFRTWIGFGSDKEGNQDGLPNLKKSVLSPLDALKEEKLDKLDKQKLKLLYARNYSLYNDMNILFKCFRDLGQK
jgi:GT2 family glycosyltransferase